MYTLRPYQTEQMGDVLDAIAHGYNRVVWTAPGGCGKTTTFSELTRHFLTLSKKVLILVDSRELVDQAFKRVSEQCGLTEFDVGIERAKLIFSPTNVVVIAMIQTIRNPRRLAQIAQWGPDVVIVDEAHVSSAPSYRLVYQALGVYEGRCIQIGTTATLKRLDKTSLAAVDPKGLPYEVEDPKTKEKRPASPDESIYQVHCSDYSLLAAIADGWLVEPKGQRIPVPIDLSKVKATRDGKTNENDFVASELSKEVNRTDVNDKIVSAWKRYAPGRQTIAYCCSVDHAKALAAKFNAAGVPALAIDGTTPDDERDQALRLFRVGAVRVLTNYGVYGKGVDVDSVGCILVARPTKSWSAYVQWVYRGTRVLEGVLKGLEDSSPESRILAIAASAKRECIVLDLVGNSGKHKPCTLPVILDLPANLDLEGRGIVEAHRLLEEHKAHRHLVTEEGPTTFTELEMILKEVDLLKKSKARSRPKWRATGGGYTYTKVPPGYKAQLLLDPPQATLSISFQGRGLLTTRKPYGNDISGYMDSAEVRILKEVEKDKADRERSKQAVDRGTMKRLSPAQRNVLMYRGHTPQEVNRWPYAKAAAVIKRYVEQRREQQAR